MKQIVHTQTRFEYVDSESKYDFTYMNNHLRNYSYFEILKTTSSESKQVKDVLIMVNNPPMKVRPNIITEEGMKIYEEIKGEPFSIEACLKG